MGKRTIRELTPKQEAFVHAIISGMTYPEAYIHAYPAAADWKPGSVTTEANRLIRKPHVYARYQQLKEEYNERAKSHAFYDRDCLLTDFMFLRDESKESIEQYGVKQANSNAYVNALKNIGEILELYPDKKLDISASVSSDFEINILGDGDEDKPEAIEGTCSEVEDRLELDKPTIEIDLVFSDDEGADEDDKDA